MLKVWKEIPTCNDTLKSAWNIPELEAKIKLYSSAPNPLLEGYFERNNIDAYENEYIQPKYFNVANDLYFDQSDEEGDNEEEDEPYEEDGDEED